MLGFIERTLVFSVKPQYANAFIAGRKTVELRRRFSSDAVIGTLAFIYSSSPAKTMVASATIADVRRLPIEDIWNKYNDAAAVSREDFDRYFEGLDMGYAIILENVRRLSKPLPATDLKRRFGFRAPQSYGYFSAKYRKLAG